MEANTGGHSQAIRPGHTRIHGRTEHQHGGTVQEQPRTDRSMALYPIHSHPRQQPRLVNDWMNPLDIPGERFLNTIKEQYDKIKKSFST
jgi:hypothetical protein